MRKILPYIVILLVTTGAALGEGSTQRMREEWKKGGWIYRGEIFGSFGWAAFYHGKHREFSGLYAAAGIGVRPFHGVLSGLGFEGRISYLGSSVETSSDILVFSGCALYHFSRSRVQPFVLGGMGALQGERTVIVDIGPGPEFFEQERYQENWNKIGFEFGGGVKIAITEKLGLRPEFRFLDTTPGEGYNLGIPQLNITLSYHW